MFALRDDGYANNRGGTSLSAPLVSGVAALIKQQQLNLSSEELRRIIKTTATDLGAKGPDNVYGYGVINAEKAYETAFGKSPKMIMINRIFRTGGFYFIIWVSFIVIYEIARARTRLR